MSFNIGDYVRTEYGVITKIDNIVNFEQENQKPYLNFNNMLVWTENDRNVAGSRGIIIKSSPNIIDLIEVGDYVNGIYIEGNNGKYLETLEHDMENSWLGHIEYIKIYPNEIESIVTKEQFESMEYKIGE